MRRPLSSCLAATLLAALASLPAQADEMPIRKAGLWELKMVRAGAPMPEMTMQHCTDATTDRDMTNSVSPMARQICAKQQVQKTATGWTSDSVCSLAGVQITSHSEVSGDFESAYTVKTTSHAEAGPKAAPRETTSTIEAKWLGPCKADQKPGDIVMPGGFKLNVRDADKLKGFLPK